MLERSGVKETVSDAASYRILLALVGVDEASPQADYKLAVLRSILGTKTNWTKIELPA